MRLNSCSLLFSIFREFQIGYAGVLVTDRPVFYIPVHKPVTGAAAGSQSERVHAHLESRDSSSRDTPDFTWREMEALAHAVELSGAVSAASDKTRAESSRQIEPAGGTYGACSR